MWNFKQGHGGGFADCLGRQNPPCPYRFANPRFPHPRTIRPTRTWFHSHHRSILFLFAIMLVRRGDEGAPDLGLRDPHLPALAGLSSSLLIGAMLRPVAARVGGAGVMVGAIRVTFWGALAMALTAGVGALFGTAAA